MSIMYFIYTTDYRNVFQITHVDDADNRNELVDNRAGNWPQHVVQQMFELSDSCLYEKKRRPLMPAVIEKLELLIC